MATNVPEMEFFRLPTKLRRASLRGAKRPIPEPEAPPSAARPIDQQFVNASVGSEGAPSAEQTLRAHIADLETQLQDRNAEIEGLQTELEVAKSQPLADASKALNAWLSGPIADGDVVPA